MKRAPDPAQGNPNHLELCLEMQQVAQTHLCDTGGVNPAHHLIIIPKESWEISNCIMFQQKGYIRKNTQFKCIIIYLIYLNLF